jgi:RNA polymerase sigma-70 factor (ECF subfamily)
MQWKGPENEREPLADESLVALAKDGDHEAFDELVRRHRRMALRTAAAVAGRDRAEDVVQDAILLSFQALPTLQDSRRFPQWLGTIARFRALRVARVEGRRAYRQVPFDDTFFDETVSSPEGADETELPRLEDALSRIPEPFEKVLRLHFFEGVPHQAIAERLGISLSTSKWRCFRGKQLLRTLLEADETATARLERACQLCLAESGACPGEKIVPASGNGLALPVCSSTSRPGGRPRGRLAARSGGSEEVPIPVPR